MKSIVIVGASSGIGNAIAKLFINMGYTVGVAARRAGPLARLVDIAPTRVHAAIIDVTSDDAPERLLHLIEKMGGTDIVFLASGIGKQNPTLDLAIEINTVRTNVFGFTQIIDTSFNYFKAKEKGGHIAAISSIAGTKGLGAAPSYSATKRYQNTYIQALDQLSSMQKLSIHFTDIRPGFVDTDLLNDSHRYPLLLNNDKVAKIIVKAILNRRHTIVVDWKYALLTPLWALIPNFIWRKLPIKN